ncbi:sensor histidine kinase [Actinocorallia sp. A-T 12471]|uniref:sensor histidine kinase n=1 Tax=Actinocorallia sp. A-T 12471 TaxID=3089813 RepID=UPI0029CB1CA3|nr:sensor histidine kinase [Actinocorallia sp. A-T 12471]MDX6741643.1 sensor histidine kinase [Actinocorallia sp. A-T 12471]
MSVHHALGRPLDAVVTVLRAPSEPDRYTCWPDRARLRLVILVSVLPVAIGLTGGSIAIYVGLHGVSADIAWPLGVLQCLPVLVAPRWPVPAWRVVMIGLLFGALVGGGDAFMPWPVTSLLALVGVLFAVGASSDQPKPLGAGLVTVSVIVLLPLGLGRLESWFGLILAGLVILALVFGDAVGGRYLAEMRLALQAERHRHDQALNAVLEERSRIARELHDVVAHHMSVIALQAEAAPYKIHDLPEPARETFALLRDEARSALTETRRVVGLLRAGSEAAERAPQPGADRIPELLDAHEGLRVTLSVTGTHRALPDAVDLSAYRIVQEALSNAARYAPGSSVEVEVHYGEHELLLKVRDDGAKDKPQPGNGGHGLLGMRERVAMLGGSLETGPRPEGGWAVSAGLPYDGRHDPGGDR